ncbi:hypothetical protein D9M68_890000 [compost metagenome]|jgi:hypothetical protein
MASTTPENSVWQANIAVLPMMMPIMPGRLSHQNADGSWLHQPPLAAGPEPAGFQLPATFMRFTRIEPTVLAP